MTAPRPGGKPGPFGPDELDGVAGLRPDELAAETRVARELEAVAVHGGVAPTSDFSDRVMAAVAAEPLPAPVIAAGSALRHGAAMGLLASLRDSFRVAFGGGFPAVVRAQALALVLVVVGVDGRRGLRGRGRSRPPGGAWLAVAKPVRHRAIAVHGAQPIAGADGHPDRDLRDAIAIADPLRVARADGDVRGDRGARQDRGARRHGQARRQQRVRFGRPEHPQTRRYSRPGRHAQADGHAPPGAHRRPGRHAQADGNTQA